MDKSEEKLIEELKDKTKTLRQDIITTTMEVGHGHLGPALSCAEILVTLYCHIMNIDPKNPYSPERDRFILSKGHAVLALYPMLAEAGFFPTETLKTFQKEGSSLPGHPDMRKLPGIESSTGALGHGLSIGVGIALAGKMDKKDYRVFVLLGDGEVQEGSIWEAAMSAAHFKLDNLVAIVDRNKLENDGQTEKIMALEPLHEKWQSFNWAVREIDGHDIGQLIEALSGESVIKGKPKIIIAQTIKGKGVSFMEDRKEWHHSSLSPQQAEQAIREIESPERRCSG